MNNEKMKIYFRVEEKKMGRQEQFTLFALLFSLIVHLFGCKWK